MEGTELMAVVRRRRRRAAATGVGAGATGLRLYTPLHLVVVCAPRDRRRNDTRRRCASHTIGRTLV